MGSFRAVFLQVSRLALALLFVLLFASCGQNEVDGEADVGGPTEGVVQGRVDGDTAIVAIGMAPKTANGEAPDLSALRGRDLLEMVGAGGRSQSATRARSFISPSTVQNAPGEVIASIPSWNLQSDVPTVIMGQQILATANDSSGFVPTCYVSDDCVYWSRDYDLSSGTQKLSVQNGILRGEAEISIVGDYVMAAINQGYTQLVTRLAPSTDRTRIRIYLILPLENGLVTRGMSPEVLREYAGTWKVEANPAVAPFPGDTEGGTPFSFGLRALMVENVTANYVVDAVDPVTKEPVCQGAVFKASAMMLPAPADLSDERGPLYWKAEIFAAGDRERTVATRYGTQAFDGAGTEISVSWDGKATEQSATGLPGGKKYGVVISALLGASEQVPKNAKGRVIAMSPVAGPPELVPDTVELTVSPKVYIPYTDEEVNNYTADENGYYQWNDNDGDGIPNFPDHDGNGVQDFEPGDLPPKVSVKAYVGKPGYKTSWHLNVYEEGGKEIFAGAGTELGPPWSGNEKVDVEWTPRADLKQPQTISYVLTISQCRAKPVVQILGQTTGENCEGRTMTATQQIGKESEVELSILQDSRLLGSSRSDSDEELENRILNFWPGHNDEVQVKVEGLRFVTEPWPEEISVSMESLVGFGTDTAVLSRQTDDSYLGDYTISDELIKQDDTGYQTTYSGAVGSGISTGPQELLSFIIGMQRSLFFGTTRKMGEMKADDDADLNPKLDDIVSGSKLENVRTFGFETVNLELRSAELPASNLSATVQAGVKLRHRANVFYLTAHGNRKLGGVLGVVDLNNSGEFETDSDLAPSQMLPEEVTGLKTLIFASCEILDLHDYTNGYLDHLPSSGLVSRGPSSGLAWWDRTGRGRTILLGYTHPVAGDAGVMPAFYSALDQMSQVPDSTRQQLAWLKANVSVAAQYVDPFGTTLRSACAYDDKYFYYAAHAVLSVQEENGVVYHSHAEDVSFRRIPVADWSKELPYWGPWGTGEGAGELIDIDTGNPIPEQVEAP